MPRTPTPTALTRAIRANDPQGVRRLVERLGKGVLEHRRTTDLCQPLHIALDARPCQGGMVRLLLELGADPNASDGKGRRALHQVERGVSDHLIPDLLAHGADTEQADLKGTPALHAIARADALGSLSPLLHGTSQETLDLLLISAAAGGAEATLHELLRRGANPSARRADHGRASALVEAARAGHAGCVSVLLAAGADSKPSVARLCALGHASDQGHLACVQAMLEAGVSADGSTRAGEIPLHAAARRGHFAIVDALLAAGANPTKAQKDGAVALHAAAASGAAGAVDCARALLAAGTPVDICSTRGNRALISAARHGALELVELLTAAGANPNHEPRDGRPPLIQAAIGPHPDVAEHLLSCGADPRAGCGLGHTTALHEFARRASLSGIAALIAADADPNATTDRGLRPLHVLPMAQAIATHRLKTAAERTAHSRIMLACAHLLLLSGADPQARSRAGESVLHAAAEHSTPDLMREFITRGVDPNATTTTGDTALHCLRPVNLLTEASEDPLARARECIDLLLEAGADPSRPNREGKTPAQLLQPLGLADYLQARARERAIRPGTARTGASPTTADAGPAL